MSYVSEKSLSQNVHKQRIYMFYTLVALLYSTILCVTHVLTYRMVLIHGVLISGGSFTIPLCYTISDIVAEVYGYKVARQLIWFSLFCLMIFAIVITLVIHFPFPPQWKYNESYNNSLGHIFRAATSTVVGFLVSSFCNVYVLSKWKILVKGKFFWFRSLGSSVFGEAFFMLAMLPISFYGQDFMFVVKIGTASYIIKIIYNIMLAAPASAVVLLLKNREGIDVFDINTKFTPFGISLD